ncbi:MAG TPA: 16S rRNA (cytosine(1402)-N(4))-methyltransferase RsmH [Planctomycetota bacterium]|nr:16S rRNA (cytosine(1402)-N(4))-methyltransferase RsmH [Planctomycetota bacterium]
MAPAEIPPHVSVLLNESLEHLQLRPGQTVADCTLGAGGHSAAFIERIKPNGRLIAFDVDPEALSIARARLQPLADAADVSLDFVQDNFRNIRGALAALHVNSADAVFADLGVSSMQFDRPHRGFSFRFDEPLDMRMDPTLPQTAADLLRTRPENEIADIIYQYGEERKSRRIARAIVEQRRANPVETTGQLEELVRRALRVRRHERIHPATRTFQALRIAVNGELDALQALLSDGPELLTPGGRIGIITFHSLEDRLVKHAFKALDQTGRFQQTVKFVAASDAEIEQNPRSRSAKLRVLERCT